MTDFFQTGMGRKFYDHDVPRIADALERIADALEKLTTNLETEIPPHDESHNQTPVRP